MHQEEGKGLYEFSDFQLDIPERLLTNHGTRIQLPEKAFETLCVLVQEAGHLVSKKELMSRVWPDTFVEENSLDKSVSSLRQILGERNGTQKYIETVRGHGYRFIAEVHPVSPAAAETTEPSAAETETPRSSTIHPKTSFFRIAVTSILLALLLLAVVLATLAIRKKEQAVSPNQRIESLAVLPLRNLSNDAAQEYFADAMTEELITKLAQIASLQIISRTSVMEYKTSRKSVPQIADELKVDAILEGSVLQVGDRVRITMQLIDGETDVHLWAHGYERDLRDILALQNDIATVIANEVQATVTAAQSSRFASAYKVNPEAYRAYLRGLYYSDRQITSDNLHLASEMFRKAVEIDPNFAIGHANLSRSEALLYFTNDPAHERLRKSKIALDRAFEIEPDLPEAHFALANYYYFGFRDYEKAMKQLKIAERGMSGHKILALQGAIQRRQGNWEDTLGYQQKMVRLNPRSAASHYDIGYTYFLLRQYEKAGHCFQQSISLGPDEQNGYAATALNLVFWKGNIPAAKIIIGRAPDKNTSWFIKHQFWLEYLDRNYEEALKVLSNPLADAIQKQVFSGLVYLQKGDKSLAKNSFESARRLIQNEEHRESGDYSIHGFHGLALAGLGEKRKAIEEGRRAVELLPVSKDAMWGPNRVETLAAIYTLTGEHDAALDQLEYLLSIPARFSIEMLRLDPIWDPLRSHPRYKKLLTVAE